MYGYKRHKMSRLKTKNIVVIIQARMGSTRLYGKVMMEIMGKPMLWHIVTRLSRSKLINKIVIATSLDRKDDIIADFCEKQGINFYRGSEKDVLDRYYQAVKLYNADVAVRITGDCPLIDYKITDKAISCYLKNIKHFSGASNVIERTYPRGFDTEVISREALEQVWKKAKKNYQREHVTSYIYEHPDLFNMYSVKNNKDLSYLRWTVDKKADLRLDREIYKKLFQKKNIFLMKDILKIVEKEPVLMEINKNIKQKELLTS